MERGDTSYRPGSLSAPYVQPPLSSGHESLVEKRHLVQEECSCPFFGLCKLEMDCSGEYTTVGIDRNVTVWNICCTQGDERRKTPTYTCGLTCGCCDCRRRRRRASTKPFAHSGSKRPSRSEESGCCCDSDGCELAFKGSVVLL